MATTVKLTKGQTHKAYVEALRAAHWAGLAAVDALNVTPMYVGTPRNTMDSLMGGDGGGFDLTKRVYHVADGVCGFATLKVRGDRKFQNFLTGKVKSRYNVAALLDAFDLYGVRYDAYYGGVSMGVGVGNQSYQKKDAYGWAFARTLAEKLDGVSTATVYCDSRLD